MNFLTGFFAAFDFENDHGAALAVEVLSGFCSYSESLRQVRDKRTHSTPERGSG